MVCDICTDQYYWWYWVTNCTSVALNHFHVVMVQSLPGDTEEESLMDSADVSGLCSGY